MGNIWGAKLKISFFIKVYSKIKTYVQEKIKEKRN